MKHKVVLTIVILLILSQQLVASEKEIIPTLFESNHVNYLSNDVIINSVNGLDKAVMDVIPISLNLDAFNLQNERIESSPFVTGQRVKLTLPADIGAVILDVKTLEQDGKAELLTYAGILEGHRNSSFVITSDGNRMMGQIVANNQLFNIKSFIEEGEIIHTLTWIDRNLIDSSHFNNDFTSPKEVKNNLRPKNQIKKNKQTNTKSGGSNTVIKMLYLFGNNVSNPWFLAKNIQSKYNTVLYNSGISHRVSVADVQVLSTNFGADCRVAIVNKMKDRTSYFSNLNNLISNTKADMVLTIAKGDANINCGYGINSGRVGGYALTFNQANKADNSNDRFANTSDNYALGDLTAIHEIGHAMGGYHATDFSNGIEYTSARNNNQAIVSNDETEQTIMGGYNWENCDFVEPTNGNVPVQNCIRIEHFSEHPTTKKFLDKSLIGSSTRNVATYFKNTTMPEIATYQTGNPSAPSTAPTLTVTNLNCYGENLLEWSFVNLADSYEVYRSDSIHFTYPVRVSTTMDFNVALFANHSQDAYYRVKACNDAGCSGYSNQVFGYYLAGCM